MEKIVGAVADIDFNDYFGPLFCGLGRFDGHGRFIGKGRRCKNSQKEKHAQEALFLHFYPPKSLWSQAFKKFRLISLFKEKPDDHFTIKSRVNGQKISGSFNLPIRSVQRPNATVGAFVAAFHA